MCFVLYGIYTAHYTTYDNVQRQNALVCPCAVELFTALTKQCWYTVHAITTTFCQWYAAELYDIYTRHFTLFMLMQIPKRTALSTIWRSTKWCYPSQLRSLTTCVLYVLLCCKVCHCINGNIINIPSMVSCIHIFPIAAQLKFSKSTPKQQPLVPIPQKSDCRSLGTKVCRFYPVLDLWAWFVSLVDPTSHWDMCEVQIRTLLDCWQLPRQWIWGAGAIWLASAHACVGGRVPSLPNSVPNLWLKLSIC